MERMLTWKDDADTRQVLLCVLFDRDLRLMMVNLGQLSLTLLLDASERAVDEMFDTSVLRRIDHQHESSTISTRAYFCSVDEILPLFDFLSLFAILGGRSRSERCEQAIRSIQSVLQRSFIVQIRFDEFESTLFRFL